jgi:hypothetical protein
MPPEPEFHKGYCREHSTLHYDPICPKCANQMIDAMKYEIQTLKMPPMPGFLTEAEPVSLGRFEDRTQEDREFLAACGINVD